MCGISGILKLNNQKVNENELFEMMKAIKHRGPDDEGFFINEQVGLGFVRLSILDLSSAGNQPFKSDDNRYVMIFNGEIYNYLELKTELEQTGISFKTQTDTEVLLKAYIYWGEQAFDKFNGMWALAIYDTIENTILFSRDRFGIKPFYYYYTEDSFYFASEISAILNIKKEKNEANESVIYDYLVFNKTEQSEQSFFKGIFKLMHACSLKINLNEISSFKHIQIKKWYNLNDKVKQAEKFKSPEEYLTALRSALEIHMRSDVKLGVSLSGGIDSSALTVLALDQDKDKEAIIETFSAVFEDSFKGNEIEYVKLFSEKRLQKNFIYTTSENLFDKLDDYLSCFSEPVQSTSPFVQYRVMQEASRRVKVMIDGQGADEQLAGYHYFFGIYYKELLLKLKWWKLFREIFYYLFKHKSVFALKSFFFFLITAKGRTKYKLSEYNLYTDDFIKRNIKKGAISGNLYSAKNLREALINHFEYKLEHLLKWADRNSMHFSIEARVPFLDHRLVEKTLASDADMIIHKGMTKDLLREALVGIIPEKIRVRKDKIGYVTPQHYWFKNENWQRRIKEIIESKSFRSRGIFKVDKVKKTFENQLINKKDISREIWKWICIELWYRKYID